MNNYTEHTTETLTKEYKKMIAEVVRREKLIDLGMTEEEAIFFEIPTVLGKQCLTSVYIDDIFFSCKEFAGVEKAGITLEFTLAEAKEFAAICKDFCTTFAPGRKTLRARVNAYCKMRIQSLYSYNYTSDTIGFIED